MTLRVFISHNSKDDPFVSNLAEQLKEIGINSFVDHIDIRAGQAFTTAVTHALDECSKMIAVISDESCQSKYCMSEWVKFLEQTPQKEVIPFWLSGKDMIWIFQAIKYIDYRKSDPKAMKELIEVLTDDDTNNTYVNTRVCYAL
ncbi:MAG: toll/interleukin-1 receptor domain-containing protein [Anaerolineae bacterium]|nr:toll/interleukin-1 receptor domain-containing protein [Anaerolineae bacterium]